MQITAHELRRIIGEALEGEQSLSDIVDGFIELLDDVEIIGVKDVSAEYNHTEEWHVDVGFTQERIRYLLGSSRREKHLTWKQALKRTDSTMIAWWATDEKWNEVVPEGRKVDDVASGELEAVLIDDLGFEKSSYTANDPWGSRPPTTTVTYRLGNVRGTDAKIIRHGIELRHGVLLYHLEVQFTRYKP